MYLPTLLVSLLQHTFRFSLSADGPGLAPTSYGAHHAPVDHDPPAVARFFPQPAGEQLHSPYFLEGAPNETAWKLGVAGPTSEDQLDSFLRRLAADHAWATYETLEVTSEEGRPLRYIKASSTNGAADGGREKLRIWVQGGAHGNEPGGDQGALAFLGQLGHNASYAADVLADVDLLVLPRYNPDGVSYFTRTLATGFDPNRDHLKLARQQTKDIKALLNAFNPHVAVDAHEYSANRLHGAGGWGVGSDGLFAAAKNLNIDGAIRALSEDVFAANLASDLASQNFTVDAYMTGAWASKEGGIAFKEADSDAKIGRNAVGLTQAVSFLLETRGVGLGGQHFARRTATMRAMIASLVDTAVAHADAVRATVEEGRERWADGKGEVVVRDRPTAGVRPFWMCSPSLGRCETKQVEWLFTTPTVPILTRARPGAYIIPRGWADVADRLRALGLEVEPVAEPFAQEVEALMVDKVVLSGTYYEGAVNVAIETHPERQTVSLPAGSFRVPSKQQRFALAVAALEPEGIDSFAAFNLIPVAVGDTFPIFRLVHAT